MNNFLKNGSVLPSGLLSHNPMAHMESFKRTYQNTALKTGVIVASYDISDPQNVNKFFIEYDVLVFEQNEDKGASVSVYKNCPVAKSLGSLADFFEMNLRKIEKTTTTGTVPHISGHNGSVVLLLCLNGFSDTGIIVGALDHPDRKTTLTDAEPHLEGEYNGVHIVVNSDGSTALTFKGATDNDANAIDSSQGNTSISIEKDGSLQVQHSTITLRLDKQGVVTLTSTDDLNINCKDATVTANGNINANCKDATVTASGTATIEGKTVKLGSGAAEAVIKGETFKKMVFDVHIHPTPIGPTGTPSIPMDPNSLSKKVKTE